MELDGNQWRDVLGNLRACKLLASESAHNPDVLDCHPLIREHYADKLRSQHPDAWQAAHRRLYEHLTKNAEHQPDTLAGLQPLYQAVAHGCLAGMYEEASEAVYRDRILRRTYGPDAFYSWKKLGAVGSDLAAVACFFHTPFTVPSDRVTEVTQEWLLNEAGLRLKALGLVNKTPRLFETSLEACVKREDWAEAAIRASNLSESQLTLGRLAEAVQSAERSVAYGDRSNNMFLQTVLRVTSANAMFQFAGPERSAPLFEEAEARQANWQSEYPRLYALQGFLYCDLLLAPAECAAWQVLLNPQSAIGASHPDSAFSPERSASGVERGSRTDANPLSQEACQTVHRRATQTLEWAEQGGGSLVTIALDHLSLGRVALYKAILAKSQIRNPRSAIEQALEGLRQANSIEFVALALPSRALLRFVEEDVDSCRADLDEAWQIAERGSMKLHMADVHLHRARLFRDKEELGRAKKLIDECGYHRRDPELQDAEQAAQNW
jgi:hypothetical protein